MSGRRVALCILWGFVFGVLSWFLFSLGGPVVWQGIAAIVTGTALMGFGIGISGWHTRWWVHGLTMGLIFRVPSAYTVMWVRRGDADVILTLLTGLAFGFLIELITTFFFKAGMPPGKVVM